MGTTNPLPIGFAINGYRICLVAQTTEICHVYQVEDVYQTPFLIREFCPQGVAVRDPESGKLRYPGTMDIEKDVIPLKNDFEAQFRSGSLSEISMLGTIYLVCSMPASPKPVGDVCRAGAPRSVRQHARDKKSSPLVWVIVLILLGGAYGIYQYGQQKNEAESPPTSQRTSGELAQEPPVERQNSEELVPAVNQGESVRKNISSVVAKEDVRNDGVAAIPAVDGAPKPSETAEPDTREKDSGAEQVVNNVPASANDSPSKTVDASVRADVSPAPGDVGAEELAEEDQPDSGMAEPPVGGHPQNGASNQPRVRQTTSSSAVAAYLRKYAKPFPLQKWKEQYGELYTSWFGDADEVAQGWITTFGPLGFRARGLDVTWSNPNFRAMFPKQLQDANGEPVANLYMVTQVIQGSPADQFIHEGDLILGIDGQYFKTSRSLDTLYGPYQHQDNRGLDMHAGLLVDKAEGAGRITLNVIPADSIVKIQPVPSLWKEVYREAKVDRPVHFSVPVKGGQQVRLAVDDGGNGIGSDGFEWSNLVLEGKGGSLPLTKVKPVQYNVGYGEAKYESEKKVWLAHAASSIVFDIPAGDWKLKGTGTKGGSASVGITVSVGGNATLPENIKKYVKNISFSIPQLGSYASGFPKNCAKSKAVVNMMSEWLVAQQREDGSWERPGGYCGNHYDTAWAGLALMSTGNPKYDAVVRKAAHYVAFSGSQCWWAVPQATAGVFLCEYWLRYRDNAVLPAIRNGVQRMKSEVLYGDFVTGHGIHPGYAGTGVSIGGSHMCLFLALASKTPVRSEDGVLDRMMNRAQELCPSGFGPYGRTTETFSFDPNREAGGTYSGRHGPYYLASLICGGPEIFTKNSRIMYGEGPIGGSDQGHSSETLSVMWAMPAYWRSNQEAYYKNMEAFRWKLTLLRPFDGGMMQNPNRLELMTADSVIGVYIRTAIWINALCAERQNLAITGKPEFQAKNFRKVPPVNDTESRFLQTYIRNWSIVNTVLGAKAPASLKSALRDMKKIPVEEGCRFKLIDLVNAQALSIAKSIMAIPNLDQLTKAACAEWILGMDIRIFFDPSVKDDKALQGQYALKVDIQKPLGGLALGLHKDKELERKARDAYKYTFSGSVQFQGGAAEKFRELESIVWKPDTQFGGQWDVYGHAKELNGPESPNVLNMTAKIQWSVNDLHVEYDRPISVGGFEVGCGEKAHPVTNCNYLWVPGILIRDHGNWGCSFNLPDGTYISAASQGNQIEVHDKAAADQGKEEKIWVSPNDACLTEGSRCIFRVSQDWLGLECRVRELKLIGSSTEEVTDYKLKANKENQIDTTKLLDRDATTSEELDAPGGEEPLVLDLQLKAPTTLRAVDIKLDKGRDRLVIEANKGGKWIPIYWGALDGSTSGISDAQRAMYANEPEVLRMLQLPGGGSIKCMRSFEPVTTNKLRIKLFQSGGKVSLAELHLYKASVAKMGRP